MADPRRCAACASYRPVADDPLGRHGCASQAARDAGTSLFPLETYGCLFWSARDPAAYRAQVIDSGCSILYANLYAQAGRTSLPLDFGRLGAGALSRLEATVIRMAQAFGALP